MDIQLDNRWAIHLFWLLPVLLLVFAYGFSQRQKALGRFASVNLIPHLTAGVRLSRHVVKAALMLLAVVFLVVSLVGPRWGAHYEQVRQRGIDVVFCLDVSRSMLAEDVSPNRLDRAKQYIRDVVDQMHGDRVGLVTFAGGALVQCPLTVDYGMFRMLLDGVGIRTAARGGTLIGDAVRTASRAFTDEIKKYKAIILITDGEDHESYPVEAAALAYQEKGIRIYTIGIGDLLEGARIPIVENGQKRYLTYKGQEIWSKLDTETLEAMAINGGGAYIPAGTSQVDMGEIYRKKIASADFREFDSAEVKRYYPRFAWFAGAACVLLMLESLLSLHRAGWEVHVPYREGGS